MKKSFLYSGGMIFLSFGIFLFTQVHLFLHQTENEIRYSFELSLQQSIEEKEERFSFSEDIFETFFLSSLTKLKEDYGLSFLQTKIHYDYKENQQCNSISIAVHYIKGHIKKTLYYTGFFS